jgi:hypothetical protein
MRKARAGFDEDGVLNRLLKFNVARDSPLGD